MFSLSEISRICGVSIATTSKALSGKPGISEMTRQRIISVAKQHNYRPNRLVHAIQKGRSMTVGIACSEFGDEFGGKMVKGIIEVLFHSSYEAMVISHDASARDSVQALRGLAERRVDGILMFPPAEYPSGPYLDELRAFPNPIVVVDQTWPGYAYDLVGSQDTQGAIAATEHLMDLGHRRIGCVAFEQTSTGMDRLRGFQQAMIRHGVAIHEKWMRSIKNIDSEEGYLLSKELLSSPERPTAIIAFNDNVALQVIAAATDLGISVPGELSVVGFGDLSFARHLRPRLTTIAQDPIEIGRRAANHLLELMESGKGKSSAPTSELLPVRLVVRDSTGAAPGSN